MTMINSLVYLKTLPVEDSPDILDTQLQTTG